MPAEATRPCAEAMLTMRPQPRARMPGSAAATAWKAAERLIAITASQRSAGNASIGSTCWMPALLTRTSTRPNRRSAVAIRSRISSGLVMSAAWNSTGLLGNPPPPGPGHRASRNRISFHERRVAVAWKKKLELLTDYFRPDGGHVGRFQGGHG